MLYEERLSQLARGEMAEYMRWNRQDHRTVIHESGGRVLCVMTGLIGSPATEVLQITRFPDYGAWQRVQAIASRRRSRMVDGEEVRLLRALAERPKDSLPDEDRRKIYGFRRFFIRPSDLEEFVYCSGEGVWPRIEAQGACILGLWTTVASTEPQEVVLLTGYHGPGHWEETRGNLPMPAGFDAALWEQGEKLGARRNELTLESWVKLMRAVELDERLAS